MTMSISEEKTGLKLFRKDYWNVWMTKKECRIRPERYAPHPLKFVVR
jgi:hypothetical protein